MQCDMCGKGFESLVLSKIEGVEMNVCNDCSKYGQFIKKVNTPQKIKPVSRRVEIQPVTERIFTIVSEYGNLIKNARENKKLKQIDLAKTLNEKESLIQKIESGHKEPSIKMARKLEKFLKIKIIEEEEHTQGSFKKETFKSKGPLTIGDMINLIRKGE